MGKKLSGGSGHWGASVGLSGQSRGNTVNKLKRGAGGERVR